VTGNALLHLHAFTGCDCTSVFVRKGKKKAVHADKGKGKGRALVIAPQVDTATSEALRYMARTKQRRTYLPYTFQAVAGTHLPTPRGWRVE